MTSFTSCLQGAFFYHTTKVGLGVSLKWGGGLLIVRKEDKEESGEGFANLWSAPVFYKVQCASLGVSAGQYFHSMYRLF